MRLLVLWSCLLLVVLFVARGCEGNPQHTPAAQKISILDLFKEDPSLKSKLEESLTSKKSKKVETPARRHSRTEETASNPVKEPTPSTTSTTTTTTTTTEITTQSTTSAPIQNARRILRPQRLSARRSRPAADKKKEVEPEAPTVQEPTVTDEANPEAEEAAPVEEEEKSAVKPQNRFSILRANRRPLLPPLEKKSSSNTKKAEAPDAPPSEGRRKFGAPRIRGNRNKAGEGVTSEPAPTTQGPRQRNSRFNSRRRSKPEVEPEEPAEEETPTETGFKPAGRLTIGGGRRRFSNARNPRQQTSTTSEPTSVMEEAQTEATRGSRFRNARVFPGSRRSSS